MRRVIITALLATFAFVVTPAQAALAACPEVGDVFYSFSNVTTSRLLTNLRSDYLRGPGTITYTKTTTGTVSGSVTGTATAEAGVIFAKASVSIGVTVGASWAKSDTWSYTKPVPSGTTARLVMYHESRKMTVTKKQIVAPCALKTTWTRSAHAPIMPDINVWDLQYA